MMFSKIKQQPAVLKALKQYEMLPSRDQLALKVLAVVMIILFLYFGLWQPAYQFKQNAEIELQQQKDLLALVMENKAALKEMSGSGSTSVPAMNSQQLVSAVTNLARQAGVLLKRFEPSGEREIKVWVEDASFDKMMNWLNTLHKTLNVKVEQISLEKTDAPGLVSARLTLSS
jgi:general secretion pathway protein M